MMNGDGRIVKELQECKREVGKSGVDVDYNPSDLRHLTGILKGPDDSPYSGGVFKVDIVIPSDYPFAPPKMKFITKVWHPNISSQTGAICLDILKDQWSPALTIKTALLSLQALLSTPEPNDPQDAEVANMYLLNITEFTSTARFWTDCYAMPRDDDEGAAAVLRLVDMGFPEEAARKALVENNQDESAAINTLLAGV
mmetsp:Transcript_8052/g.8198  ORF Transcript_8052/g.8198 Transcript_8052/m.8198 type:complete len:198 (-) Transcript_8052:137-730(-)|eukprot:CAMPEP_0182423612 /NCGR_PEP_ID=MMETSP1167-20130531/9664_1 /TAXON_ID=2988 /ORGANISM="Mallomonas Sp, Strain CCMP3275" /LENGTH=197 /DNA_ID=CAMNT_0024602747 /DNA_START=92 /DNA_END=685 /DNA_ORIENTATION=-